MTLFLSFVNYVGLSIVGWGTVALGVVSLAPFVLMTAMAVPKVRPRRWAAQVSGRKDWRLFFNTLFWNLNYWDSASTMAGEVERPERTFPRALALAGGRVAPSFPVARQGRTAGCLGQWLLGRCRRHYRGPMAQVLDGGRCGDLLHRHVRGPDEQWLVPAPRYGGTGPRPV
uniref:Uncharacterized protein n=1 Tax=Triticum urartu TaxID=4572 RepID=A0A8R7VDA3_TRIUA